MSTQVSDQAWASLAQSLDVERATLQAVAAVEAAGSGFLEEERARPKVLFEGHAFHRLTGGRFAQQAPGLSYPKWDKSQYSGSLQGEWDRLDAACKLDRPAALQSASWGMFQIMGFNYAYCGCSDVEQFVSQQHAGADAQLALFARFVARPPYLPALRAKDWETFAAAYNGPAHAKNAYAQKLAAAYAAFAKQRQPAGRAGKRARLGKAQLEDALPPGRATFAAVPAMRRRNQFKRNVRPDSVDLRDWEYRPSIAVAPSNTLWPKKLLGSRIAQNDIRVFIANLTDAAERSDDTCKPYGRSLLYLVARSFEEHEETPLLGMERHLVPALATHRWSTNVQQLRCPGGMWDGSSAATRATVHGGVDDDQAVRDAVAAFIGRRR